MNPSNLYALTIATVAAMALAACDTVPKPPIVAPLPPSPVVCPASATAAIQPRPVGPTLTPEQRLALDIAVIDTLGEEVGRAVLEAADDGEAWALAQVRRVEDMARWCRENAG